MDAKPLPAHPSLEQYKKQAKDLVKSRKPEDPNFTLAQAQRQIARYHGFPSWPKFAKHIEALVSSPAAIFEAAERAVITGDVATLDRLLRGNEKLFREHRPPHYGPGGLTPDYSGADARAILLREHQFETWPQFAVYLEERARGTSLVALFESAADAIVAGDAATVQRLLREHPELVRARSTRKHQAPLLHYVGGINGGENYRQKCPKNVVEIAKLLLNAGAEVDATAGMYGGTTTLGSVATGIHPLLAGVQDELMECLLDAGAAIDGNSWNIVNGCLANGRPGAAEFLARRGAKLDLEGAAGVGRLDLVKEFFHPDGALKPPATNAQMKDGFTWACEFGRTSVLDFLLQRGLDVATRLKHHGQTGLHWAAGGGNVDTVKLLLARNALVDAKDETWGATPLGWALHGWNNPSPGATPERYYQVVTLLVAAGAKVDPEWLASDKIRADSSLLAALGAQ